MCSYKISTFNILIVLLTVVLLHFALLHFALTTLLHFALKELLHIASKVVTFWVNVTFCGVTRLTSRIEHLMKTLSRRME